MSAIAAVRYESRPQRAQAPIDEDPFHEWAFQDGTLWTSFHRSEDGYLLRFPGLADFSVSASGTEVAAHPVPGVSEQTVEHLYLNQVHPLAMSRQWRLVLHGAAAEVQGGALAFVGASGRGKSTLTASFGTCGYRLLTDDGLQLEMAGDRYVVQPSHPSIRLWADARRALFPETARLAPPVDYTPKARLLADGAVTFCDAPRVLRCMYFLGEGNVEGVEIQPLAGAEVVIELVKHSFLLDIEEREMLAHHFGQVAEMAALPMSFRLDYPRRFDMLPVVRDAVIRHAAARS